jgi:hypothetical protein
MRAWDSRPLVSSIQGSRIKDNADRHDCICEVGQTLLRVNQLVHDNPPRAILIGMDPCATLFLVFKVKPPQELARHRQWVDPP